ncbi:hypothetical protein [Bacteroides eggerthii]|uniref:hypothetical protein n=1 Tax=Bacteroides eggerthii TaxID=28111 RepID=UPI000189DC8E|nr:hypothetical protein [Bacteroides eggerthii]EEC55312.1 hypothetical protein BACEGG_00340 [Bacteroides eggerthii DSM 20697]UWN87778.1 hypothetical protein NQ546_16650 [Bacteroides eggerthii]
MKKPGISVVLSAILGFVLFKKGVIMELVVLFGLIAVGCGGFLLYIVTPKGKRWFGSL